MKKVLIAVDDTKGTKKIFGKCVDICSCIGPETIILVYVEKFEGKSLMTEMLGDAELSTLEDVLKGTDYQEMLDQKAAKILGYYQKVLDGKGLFSVKTVVRKGHPAEEILKVAKKEQTEMIMVGSRGKRTTHLFMGSVSREVANNAEVPVLLVK